MARCWPPLRRADRAHRRAQALPRRRWPGVEDPERKRKIIGDEFIRVFEAEAQKLGTVEFLAQGTLYPDVIESASVGKGAHVIKSHHNVGGLPDAHEAELVEPLRDAVQGRGARAGPRARPARATWSTATRSRAPGSRCASSGAVNEPDLAILRAADAIFIEELRERGLYGKVWQAFAVLLPVRTVGVMGDERTYEHVIALRAVTSQDGMTADWARLPHAFLARVAEPHRQRGARRQPRRLRHLEQAAGDDRVGMKEGG